MAKRKGRVGRAPKRPSKSSQNRKGSAEASRCASCGGPFGRLAARADLYYGRPNEYLGTFDICISCWRKTRGNAEESASVLLALEQRYLRPTVQ